MSRSTSEPRTYRRALDRSALDRGALRRGGGRLLLAALLVLGSAVGAQAMARRPATIPAGAAPTPAWLTTGDGTAMPGEDELAVRWLGTAGYEIRSKQGALLIDPYYSRPSLGTLLGGPAKADEARVKAHVRPVDAVFVGHGHFDHFLDAPLAAKLTGATLYTSATSIALAAQEGLPEAQRRVVRAGDVIRVGDITVEVVEGRHSSMPTQFLAGGAMDPHAKLPLRFLEYKNGDVFGFLVTWRGRTLYHNGSAEFVEAGLAGRRAETVLFCVSGWKSTPGVFKRVYEALKPAAIMPMHHDDFFKPFEAGVQENLLAAHQEALHTIRRDAPGAAIVAVDFFDDHRFRARDPR